MTTSKWQVKEELELSKDSLLALLNNEIPAIRIKNFATREECASFAAAVEKAGLKYYSVARRIGYIGMAQYEYRWGRPKEDYFADVQEANKRQRAVFSESFDVVQRVIDVVGPHTENGICVAHEDGHEYYAGIIRQASEGVDLHADFAPFNSPTYAIRHITSQLGWNFYAEQLVEGGLTTVHNAPWNPVMEGDVPPQSYDLPREVVAGAETYTFSPDMGDVVIFNTRNPHEISGGVAAEGRNRISIGAFIGRMPNKELFMWS